MTNSPPTDLLFHHNSTLTTHPTTVLTIVPFSSLPSPDQSLFKSPPTNAYVLTFPSTIFHPQGGGQPSDEGHISLTSSPSTTFSVISARHSATNPSQVLHLGHSPSSPPNNPPIAKLSPSEPPFSPGDKVTQQINAQLREYYSRLHTAGHVLGSAVRHLLESQIENFDELKASHFPDSAACEFRGLIEGKWKGPIQEKVDEFLAAKMPVEIDWWDESDFQREGLERLIPRDEDGNIVKPETNGGRGGKWRVVRIVGAEVYPCGGTHVERTDLCGEVNVRKIGRSKGCSRVSYSVAAAAASE
ncbi:Threonyl/alanyl tRNA synthetase [Triangularia verruculosa]|uniref:Threonyl/alanyl tRNA synthetase n=1 Tax=Triangularia verruculosa TaxID=2587418 RepID=A0AAN6XGJ1_9PEZI|nr:Threonyl/alanyl tRNA synthetase [Triangularia verruculosa]